MSEPWFYRAVQNQVGPLRRLALQELATAGKLAATDLVREGEAGPWVPASRVTGLEFADPPEACVHSLFEAQARRRPEAVAVTFEGRSMTYGELNARANQLAHYLTALGVGPEVLVGICLKRSLEMAVGLLGALKAGGAYVPMDPEDPPERLDFIVADSRPPVILTTSELTAKFSAPDATIVRLDADQERIAGQSENDPPCRTTPFT